MYARQIGSEAREAGLARPGLDRRSLWLLFAGGLLVPEAAIGAVVERATASRLTPTQDQPYYPPTELSTVADIYRRMTAPVQVNGAGPFDFVVDTGANPSVISQELLTHLNLPSGPPAPLNGVAGIQIAPTTTASLSFGGRNAPLAGLSILPRAAIGGAGMLGLDRLEGDQLTLDFKGQTLRIDSGARSPRDPEGIRVKAHRRDGQLTLIDVDIARVPLTAFIDSGAQSTIGNMALRSMAIDRNPSAPWISTPIVSATGQMIPAVMADLPHLRIGGVILPNWPVAFADLHTFKMWNLIDKPAILIGVDLLSRFRSVCLDFARNEVRFLLPDVSI